MFLSYVPYFTNICGAVGEDFEGIGVSVGV